MKKSNQAYLLITLALLGYDIKDAIEIIKLYSRVSNSVSEEVAIEFMFNSKANNKPFPKKKNKFKEDK